MHLCGDLNPVDLESSIGRQAQGRVQDGAVFGGVDVCAIEHRVAPLEHSLLTSQIQESVHHLMRDALLAEVDAEARGIQGPGRAAIGLIGEELPEIAVAKRFGQGLEPCPGDRPRRVG